MLYLTKGNSLPPTAVASCSLPLCKMLYGQMDHAVAVGLRNIYRDSDHPIQETTGVEHRIESADYIHFYSAQGKGRKTETTGKKKC